MTQTINFQPQSRVVVVHGVVVVVVVHGVVVVVHGVVVVVVVHGVVVVVILCSQNAP